MADPGRHTASPRVEAPRFQRNSNSILPTTIVSKATTPERECYSDFGTTNFETDLRAKDIARLFVGGLATDYCVFHTVKDALALDFTTFLLRDAIRGVNVQSPTIAKKPNKK